MFFRGTWIYKDINPVGLKKKNESDLSYYQKHTVTPPFPEKTNMYPV